MAFQFKRDRSQNLELILAGDIDLEVTPEIKTQLVSQLEDANALAIDGKNISYLDSSGVSILVIAMQSCKQKQLGFKIPAISEEAFRVLELAKLNKILPIENVSGPAQLVDVDAFSGVSGADSTLANELSGGDSADNAADFGGGSSDDDLIAALASGDMGVKTDTQNDTQTDTQTDTGATPQAAEPESEDTGVSLEMTPEPEPAQPAKPAKPEPAAQPAPSPDTPSSGSGGSGGGGFTPGTF